MEIFTHILALLDGLVGGFSLKIAVDARRVRTTDVTRSSNSQGTVNQTGDSRREYGRT